ncbi:MAG: RsmD family RNA methyltransferase [Planctomycetota bacterium]
MPQPRRNAPSQKGSQALNAIRIIGGDLRGRKLEYSGDPRTRPMKDRVREALFNLLGPGIRGKHAIDLFAGTGALGLEAISRGAASATFVEQHFPTAQTLRRNAASLGVESRIEVSAASTFIWWRQRPTLPSTPWVVFSSPPYAFYASRRAEMLSLLDGIWNAAPPGSLFALEFDERFTLDLLPFAASWVERQYKPAMVAVAARPN